MIVWVTLLAVGSVFRSSDGSDSHLAIRLILAAYLISSVNLVMTDTRLSQDPLLDQLGEHLTVTGIVKETTMRIDTKGRPVLSIEVKLLRIGDQKVRNSFLLVSVPQASVLQASVCQSSAEVLSEAGEKAPTDPSSQASTKKETAKAALPPGALIRFCGEPKLPAPRRNPGCFDYRLYLKASRIQTTLRTEELQILQRIPQGPRGWPCRLYLLREHYLSRLAQHTGEETAGMLRAILFGEKDQLDESLQKLFQKNGTAHILAVSGLHIGMLYAAMVAVWDILTALSPALFGQRRGRRFFLCVLLFFTGYAFLAGYSPSVVRAVCMILLHAFANMTRRRYDLSSAAFAVGMAALLRDPYTLFQAGFQMSFLAILTLGLVCPYIRRVYDGMLVGSIAVQIGLAPYIAYQFNILSLIAILVNVPVIALAGILVPAGMGGMLLGGALSGFYDRGLASLCEMMVRLNEWCCIDHLTSFTVASPPVWTMAAYYLGLFVFASEEGRLMIKGQKRRIIAFLAVLIIAVSLVFGQACGDGFRRMDIVFVDVGQGDCMHLRSGGRSFLIDGGGSQDYEVGTKTLRPYLLKNGVSRVDGAFVTHLHTDHYQGICELAKAGMIRRIYVYEANRLKRKQICEETGLPPEDVVFLHQGETVFLERRSHRVEKRDQIQVLWPAKKTESEYAQMIADEEDENASSLILRVTIDGITMLATGDLDEDGERQILDQYGSAGGSDLLRADILKVGHHGSKTSTCEDFLDAVRPAFAVIQVGENNMYGHPTPEVLKRLKRRGIPVWRNDRQGAIGMEVSAGKLVRIRTVIAGPLSK